MASNLTLASNMDLSKLPLTEALEAYSGSFQAALPTHIPLERFKRVVLTAINQNRELANADRRSLFNACVKCAQDGLYPDGREAALVVFGNAVSYLPMLAGIRRRMRNSGEVLSAEAEVVCRNDVFKYELGDNAFIHHIPAPLDQEPGEIVGAYAIIKLKSGEVLRDLMRRSDIEKSRAQSKSKNSLMWTHFYSEGCKKTVLRRCAKAAPGNSDLEQLWTRDEEQPEPPHLVEVPPPPRPRREDFDVETGEVVEPPKPRRGRPPKEDKIPLPEMMEPNPELLPDGDVSHEMSLSETVLLGLAGCKTPEDVDAIFAEHAAALNEIPHEQWLPLQAAIDKRRGELDTEHRP